MKAQVRIIATLVGKQSKKKTCLATFFILLITLNCLAQPSEKCASFNGINSLVYFNTNDLQLSYNNQMAIGAWVNWTNKANAGKNANIIAVTDSLGCDGQFWLQHDSTNSFFQFILKTDSGQKITVTGKTNPIVGNWYYVMGVFRTNKIELYVNGMLEGQDTVKQGTYINPYASAFKACVGNNLNNTKGFNGYIDEVSVRNGIVMDSTGAMNMMMIKFTGTETGLYSYWNMDTLNGNSAVDLGINSANGFMANATIQNWGAPSGQSSEYVKNLSVVSPALPRFRYLGMKLDSVVVDSLSFTSKGIYFYIVNGTPTNSLTPSGISTSGTKYYYGVFIPDYAGGTYHTHYYFDTTSTNKRVSVSSALSTSDTTWVLLKKDSQNPVNWVNTGIECNTLNPAFSVTCQGQWSQFAKGALVANNTTSITQQTKMMVNGTYPNPFSGNFTLALNCPKATNLKTTVLSIEGAVILEKQVLCTEGENFINFDNMGGLANGIYFVNVIDANGNKANIKLVKN